MKIDNYLLTKQDIENIELKEKIDDEINAQLQTEYINLINSQARKYNINYNELGASEINKYTLKKEYNFYDCNGMFITFGIFSEIPFLLMIYVTLFRGVKFEFPWFILFLIVIGIFLITYGSRGLIIKHKIKNNFKELGIKL
jgi:hypothetical protein